MPEMIITLEIAGALALVNLWVGFRCSRVRMQKSIMHGDAGDELMRRRMRGHSNFIENAPIFVILLALLEFTLGSSLWLWIAGIVFVIARILHPIGLDRDGPNPMRVAGAAVSMLLNLILAITALLASWGVIGPVT